MSERKNITRATGVLGLATGLSRIAGLVRDMVVAGLFGAGFGTDAFFVAFTIPNLLRRFFAEGSLTAAFVPTYSQIYHREGKEQAQEVANICMTLLVLVMTGVTLLGIWGSPWLVELIGHGFGAVEGKLELTDFLNRIMFPYIFFVSLLALLTGILNIMGHYFVPAASPLLLNLSMILCALWLHTRFEVGITALAVGVVVGGALQLLIQVPVVRSFGIRLRPDFHFGHPQVRRIAWLMLPGIAGVAIYQINVVVSRLLASFLPEGSVSFLYYGQRLFEFPQGIFIVSLAQAVLPAMSRQVGSRDDQGFRESLHYALILIALITIPASVGLYLCAEPMLSLFFMKGAFVAEDVRQTALALAAYAPGLFFVGISRVVVPAFYARQDTRTPVWISFWTLLVNVTLGLVLMRPFGHVGLAAALTLASVFNSGALLWTLRRKLGPLGLRAVVSALMRILPATVIMGAAVWALLRLVPWLEPGRIWLKGSVLGGTIGFGCLLFAFGCMLFRVPFSEEAVNLIKGKILRR
ncbi:murein biosynthesis integral membrane protein MurJ [Trichloromonas sp.]|uniref:murein biosynthesis integral membrane protein MurJ n=1 Tax=Trichloromonas sp. TaxID=3069249 RepID=UPI002A419207|nr:murein biosynthesis integral membrane protein MurJ [Trichloromonas sp.]